MENKNAFAQLFCKHKRKAWFTKQTEFLNISGQRKYQYCEDCGKFIHSIYEPNVR